MVLIPYRPRRVIPHRGDPFSHPSGSSATTKQLFVWFFSLYYSFFVFVFLFSCLFFRRPIPFLAGSRKLSVPGPRSFNTRELWFPGIGCAPEVQPVADSRHGRIACKAAFPVICQIIESRRFQSVLWLISNPVRWLAAALKISLFASLVKLRRAAASNQPKGLKVQPFSLVSSSSHKVQFFFNANSGNIRVAS